MSSSPEQCLFRFIWPRKVFSAIPVTVVERTASRVVLWIAPETTVQWPPRGRLPIAELAEQRWSHAAHSWYGSRLMIAEAGAAHSVYVTWGRNGELIGWYVNLEEPWRESPFGFDTTDHLLDVWVEPDRSWHWKDEDHLAEAVDIGLFSSEQAAEVRAEGERAIERIEAWTSPFDEGWERWRPSPGWPLPSMPDAWDRL